MHNSAFFLGKHLPRLGGKLATNNVVEKSKKTHVGPFMGALEVF
jgi:hypothetical protein